MDRNIIMNRMRKHLLDARANGYKPLYLSLQGAKYIVYIDNRGVKARWHY